jgi:hypothetical protein
MAEDVRSGRHEEALIEMDTFNSFLPPRRYPTTRITLCSSASEESAFNPSNLLIADRPSYRLCERGIRDYIVGLMAQPNPETFGTPFSANEISARISCSAPSSPRPG